MIPQTNDVMSWVQFKQLNIILQPTNPQKVHCLLKVEILDNLTSPLRLCRSCLRCFDDLKNMPLDVWSMYLVDVVDCCRFQAHPSPVRLCRSCSEKKHTPGILEHVFCVFCDFWAILMSPGKMFILWPICSNDYASKTRIEILCKKTCCVAHNLFVLSLISYVIPGKLEPWPECQLELLLDLQPTADLSWINYFYSNKPTSQTHPIINELLVEVWKIQAVYIYIYIYIYIEIGSFLAPMSPDT